MYSEQLKNGLVVQMGGQKHQVKVDGGKEVTVYEVNAVAIIYGSADENSNKVGPAARGVGFSEKDAWDRAVDEVKRQLR